MDLGQGSAGTATLCFMVSGDPAGKTPTAAGDGGLLESSVTSGA